MKIIKFKNREFEVNVKGFHLRVKTTGNPMFCNTVYFLESNYNKEELEKIFLVVKEGMYSPYVTYRIRAILFDDDWKPIGSIGEGKYMMYNILPNQ